MVEEVVANPDANGVWTVRVIDPFRFELLDPRLYEARGRPSASEFNDFPPSFVKPASWTRSDWMSGGSWRVVRDQGRIINASNERGKPIRVYSLCHRLKTGDHVEITDVRGNTKANGLWTVKVNDPGPWKSWKIETPQDDPMNWFELTGPVEAELNPKGLSPFAVDQPHHAAGGPEFDYRHGSKTPVFG